MSNNAKKEVTVVVNGQEIVVPKGTMLIEAFMKSKSAGEISHYCWHPGLSIAGACRMCMVQIEGNPKLQIACNTEVADNMVVTNQSDQVKEAVKWALEFHLINHPLDCPICDQAGECGLQEYFMTHGDYDSKMAERKVKKRKVVDLGKNVVLDTERCILCSRCVRFTDEVSKSHELGIFNRGDRSEIGTFKDKPLNNDYSLNVVDICPVGALTSKDFRFRQRVWFLENFETVCQGCSTGCNIKVYYNKNGLYRVTPSYNEKVNSHWMCDHGRFIYKFANLENRLATAYNNTDDGLVSLSPGQALVQLHNEINNVDKSNFALVLTAQYTTEEYNSLVETFSKMKIDIYHWDIFKDDFDGILIRGDKNPNTTGLCKVLDEHKIKTKWSDLESKLIDGKIDYLFVLGPENQEVYTDLAHKVKLFKKAKNVVYMTPTKSALYKDFSWQIPMKSFVEKNGTFINYKGLEQKINAGTIIVSKALSGIDVASILSEGVPKVENYG